MSEHEQCAVGRSYSLPFRRQDHRCSSGVEVGDGVRAGAGAGVQWKGCHNVIASDALYPALHHILPT